MDEAQSLDNWIVNYESGQRHKHSQFLGNLKHEFIERTRQQNRDRLDLIDQGEVPRLGSFTKVRRRIATTSHQGT